MPFVGGGIVIDANSRAEGGAAVRASRNLYIRARRVVGRPHGGQRINVVVSRPAGTVNPQELLADESSRIYVSTNHAPTHVDGGNLVKGWRHSRVLRIGRTDAPKTASAIVAANEEVAVASDVKCSPTRRIRQAKRTLPCNTAIGGAVEQSTAASSCRTPGLVLESVAGAVRSINGEPLLVTSTGSSIRLETQPRLAAVCRAVDVITK